MRSMKMFQSMTIWSLICAIQVQAVLVVEFVWFTLVTLQMIHVVKSFAMVLLERLLVVMVNVQSSCIASSSTAAPTPQFSQRH